MKCKSKKCCYLRENQMLHFNDCKHEFLVVKDRENLGIGHFSVLGWIQESLFAIISCSVTEYSKDNLMESRNLSLVLFPTIIRPDFIRLEMSTQMYFILFIQTCIEKCDYLFSTDENWEAEKDAGFTSISRLLSLVLSPCKLHPSLEKWCVMDIVPVRSESNDLLRQRDNLASCKQRWNVPRSRGSL